MATTLFYPVYLIIAFGLSLLYIPKEDYKRYFIYGLLIGGLGDVIAVTLFSNILHVIWFKNGGIFGVLGYNLLSPPSWTFTVMIFLRFLPHRRLFLYFYVLTFAFSSVGYGYLVRNVGLFDFRPWYYPVFAFFIFLAWCSGRYWTGPNPSSIFQKGPVPGCVKSLIN